MDEETPAQRSALPLVVALVAVLGLAGALAYLFLGDHPSEPEAAGSGSPQTTAVAPRSGQLELTTPAGPAFSRQYVTLQAHVTGDPYDVRLEFRTGRSSTWSPIPEERLSTEEGEDVDLPLDIDADGNTERVRWDMPATTPEDDDVAPDNAVVEDGAISIRAVAKDGDGDPLASAPAVAVLVRHGPSAVAADAPSIDDGYVFSFTPIHVTWIAAKHTFALPGGGTIDVPIAGYAVDLLNKDDLDSGWVHVPPAEIATTSTSFDVAPPVQNDHPHVIVIRAIDAAGNVGAASRTPEFLAQSLELTAPQAHAVFHGDAPVPLLALNASVRPICFEYRKATPNGQELFVPIPAGQVTDAAGKPIRRWPVKMRRTGEALQWHGLRHAPGVDGHPGARIEIRADRVGQGDCSVGWGASQDVTITWLR